MQEVGGSIPPSSTKFHPDTVLRSPSSRGLGHRPFTAVTGVRIPLGTPLKQKWPALAGHFCLSARRASGGNPGSTKRVSVLDAEGARRVKTPRGVLINPLGDATQTKTARISGPFLFERPKASGGESWFDKTRQRFGRRRRPQGENSP